MFNLTMLLHVLEPVTTLAARAYVIGGEIFTISTILFGLNMLAGLCEKVYDAGLAVGTFYKTYCHEFTKWAAIRLVGLTILMSELAWHYTKYTYKHRHKIIPQLNTYRNQIGSWFTYKSPVYMTN